jgi:cell division protein FtsI/penicillin-binding protein 2
MSLYPNINQNSNNSKSQNQNILFPDKIVFDGVANEPIKIEYTLDTSLQASMDKLIKSYRPDYAAFVAIDATTGRILSLLSYSKNKNRENLTLQARFPSASIFKIITASAAIDHNKMEPESVVAFNGSNHTLFKRNVRETTENKWTRHMSLKEAFAKSVNTVFAKIGTQILEPYELEDYAKRFQFNREIPSDLKVEKGYIELHPDNDWSLAEAASGYNRLVLMSPLQGALIAASIANEGLMMEPYIVDSLNLESGQAIYFGKPNLIGKTVKPETAIKIRQLMRETVVKGTSRSYFRSLVKNPPIEEVEFGGKTGSLWGKNPKGKCDWFVGYGISPQRRIAVAALTVNIDKWTVKSSYLSRYFMEKFFENERSFVSK